MDEILKLCYEADINIQNINYSILKESYFVLREGGENDSAKESKLKKLGNVIKSFFEKIVNAMQRMAVRLVSLIKPFRKYATKLDVEKKVILYDVDPPAYTTEDVMDWASEQFKKAETNYPTQSFDEWIGWSNTHVAKSMQDELEIVEKYKSCIDFVKTGYKKIQRMAHDYKDYEYLGSTEKAFRVYKEAVKLIQSRTKNATKYLITLYKRSVKHALKIGSNKTDVDKWMSDEMWDNLKDIMDDPNSFYQYDSEEDD